MRKFFFILLAFVSLNTSAQINVKENSFHQIDGYVMLDKNDHYDINDKPMALIKISTENITAEERRRITFKGNLETEFDAHFEPTEIYLYLSTAATFIEIHHPDYGKTEYWLPFDLKGFCGYEMVLQYIPLFAMPEPESQMSHLIIKSEPADALIFIDGKQQGQTPDVISDIQAGTYELRFEKQGYKPLVKKISVKEGETLTVNENLEIDPKQVVAKEEKIEEEVVFATADFTPENQIITVAKGVTFTMVAVEGSAFDMGATPDQGSDAYGSEKPVHQVSLSNYYIGETEVTQKLWKAVMGNNPSKNKGNQRPVDNVSWADCQAFIKKLNQMTGKNFRLPTEAEWEYAARGGKLSEHYKYSGSDDIDDVTYYDDGVTLESVNVKTKQANELGIYDMSGNVWEWCYDWYGNYVRKGVQDNPKGAETGNERVLRGGAYDSTPRECRVSHRHSSEPDVKSEQFGLRLVF